MFPIELAVQLFVRAMHLKAFNGPILSRAPLVLDFNPRNASEEVTLLIPKGKPQKLQLLDFFLRDRLASAERGHMSLANVDGRAARGERRRHMKPNDPAEF
jgi:hypothetical protein